MSVLQDEFILNGSFKIDYSKPLFCIYEDKKYNWYGLLYFYCMDYKKLRELTTYEKLVSELFDVLLEMEDNDQFIMVT